MPCDCVNSTSITNILTIFLLNKVNIQTNTLQNMFSFATFQQYEVNWKSFIKVTMSCGCAIHRPVHLACDVASLLLLPIEACNFTESFLHWVKQDHESCHPLHPPTSLQVAAVVSPSQLFALFLVVTQAGCLQVFNLLKWVRLWSQLNVAAH